MKPWCFMVFDSSTPDFSRVFHQPPPATPALSAGVPTMTFRAKASGTERLSLRRWKKSSRRPDKCLGNHRTVMYIWCISDDILAAYTLDTSRYDICLYNTFIDIQWYTWYIYIYAASMLYNIVQLYVWDNTQYLHLIPNRTVAYNTIEKVDCISWQLKVMAIGVCC